MIAGSNGYVSNALLPPAPVPSLTLLSAFFGQQDVTSLVNTKLKSGNGYHIDTFNLVQNLGVDPWVGNPKLITLLYTNGTTLRTFAISEAEGNDYLYPTSTNCGVDPNGNVWNCVSNAYTGVSPPSNSPVKLVSVVYGDKQITQSGVYSYIYSQAIAKSTMSVGSWLFGYNPYLITTPRFKASCVIWYYSAADGYQTLKAFTGKDNVAANGDNFAWNGSDFVLV